MENESKSDRFKRVREGKRRVISGKNEKGIKLYGFKDKLGRALLNMIDNAVKYTPKQGSIEMTLKKEKDKAFVKIPFWIYPDKTRYSTEVWFSSKLSKTIPLH